MWKMLLNIIYYDWGFYSAALILGFLEYIHKKSNTDETPKYKGKISPYFKNPRNLVFD